MIISKRGIISTSGDLAEMCTDLTMIISVIREKVAKEYNEKIADEVIEHVFEVSKMSEAEVIVDSARLDKQIELLNALKSAAGKGEQVKADE